MEEALEVERQENEQKRLFIQKEEQLQQILKRKNKQALLDELVRINANYNKKIVSLRGLCFLFIMLDNDILMAFLQFVLVY